MPFFRKPTPNHKRRHSPGPDSRPCLTATLAGDFAFVWSGESSDEEDFVGQMKLPSAAGNNASGIMDFNEFGAGKQFFNIQFNGPPHYYAAWYGSEHLGRDNYVAAAHDVQLHGLCRGFK